MGIRATFLAKYCLDRQPESVRRRLMRNRRFGDLLGLETRTIVTVADLGRFDREDLLTAARAALTGSGEAVLEDLVHRGVQKSHLLCALASTEPRKRGVHRQGRMNLLSAPVH